jgi:hypothetical protein
MITQINTDSLYNLFRVVDFNFLENAIDNMAPSLVEYYLSSLVGNDDLYFNKRDIEESISVGNYNLYIDYSKNIYLEELNKMIDENITQSFW